MLNLRLEDLSRAEFLKGKRASQGSNAKWWGQYFLM